MGTVRTFAMASHGATPPRSMTVQPPEPLATTQLNGRLGHHLNAVVQEKPEAAITKGDYERGRVFASAKQANRRKGCPTRFALCDMSQGTVSRPLQSGMP